MKAVQFLKKEKGFTLVELLIVIAIIGVLMGLALAGMRFAQRRARDLQRQNIVRNLSGGLEAYYVDNRSYPEVSGGTELTSSLSDYLEEELDFPSGEDADSVGYAFDNDGLEYVVCMYPEGGNEDPNAVLLTGGSDSNEDLVSSCEGSIAQ